MRALAACSVAYPVSGAIYAAIGFFRYSPAHYTFLEFAFVVGFYAILVAVTGGLPPKDERGFEHTNMYPWIIPTALVIFFLLSRGWRWFSQNRSTGHLR